MQKKKYYLAFFTMSFFVLSGASTITNKIATAQEESTPQTLEMSPEERIAEIEKSTEIPAEVKKS